MEILIASDHRGFEFKQQIIKFLETQNQIVYDFGTSGTQSVDYPDYAHKLSRELKSNQFGILICGSGIGMSIAANRHKNIRAALCRNKIDAELSRKHNNANVIVLGSDNTDVTDAIKIVDKFLNTKFEQGRHAERVNKINIGE